MSRRPERDLGLRGLPSGDAGDGSAGPDPRDAYAAISDAALLRRHVAGEPDAFGELVRRHRERLWAVALRTTGSPEEAADALQDALVSAFRAASGYRGEAAVTTWLHRIVVNACLDRLRRRAARPSVPLDDDAVGPAAPDEVAARETSLDVSAALATLGVEQRAAIVLVDLQGWSVDEAARILDVAPGTVKSRCARGRARLAPLLAHLRPAAGAGGGAAAYAAGNRPPPPRVASPATPPRPGGLPPPGAGEAPPGSAATDAAPTHDDRGGIA